MNEVYHERNKSQALPYLLSMEKVSGIYKIINKTNGKYYIGSSVNIKKRWFNHKHELNKNNHGNDYLQNAWNKYGKDAFDFMIVESIPAEKLIEVEQQYLNNIEKDKCYNLSFIADKIEMTIATRKKMSESHKGEKNANYGKRMSEGMKQAIRARNKLQKPTAEQKQKQREALLGDKNPMFGKHHSEETKKKITAWRHKISR